MRKVFDVGVGVGVGVEFRYWEYFAFCGLRPSDRTVGDTHKGFPGRGNFW